MRDSLRLRTLQWENETSGCQPASLRLLNQESKAGEITLTQPAGPACEADDKIRGKVNV